MHAWTIGAARWREWIELYLWHGVSDEGNEIVPRESWGAVLGVHPYWEPPIEAELTARFGTTDKGFAAYRHEIGWQE